MPASVDTARQGRLILILSSERSGSTLTRVTLGEHSRIVAPSELFLMRYPTYEAWRRLKSVAMESLVEFFELIGSPKSAAEIDAVCRDFSMLQVYQWMLGAIGPDTFLLDKTPAYANDGETLRRSLPLSPFYIWLIRHPLGVIESHVRIKREARRKPGIKGLQRTIRDGLLNLASIPHKGMTPLARQRETKWVVQQTIIREFLATVPKAQQHTMRFEQLVSNPEATVRELCAAIGVEVEPAMLEACGARRVMNVHLGDPNFHKHDRIESNTAEAWRAHFSEDGLTLETRRLMAALGVGGASTSSLTNR